jgi:hypothetical protein
MGRSLPASESKTWATYRMNRPSNTRSQRRGHGCAAGLRRTLGPCEGRLGYSPSLTPVEPFLVSATVTGPICSCGVGRRPHATGSSCRARPLRRRLIQQAALPRVSRRSSQSEGGLPARQAGASGVLHAPCRVHTSTRRWASGSRVPCRLHGRRSGRGIAQPLVISTGLCPPVDGS